MTKRKTRSKPKPNPTPTLNQVLRGEAVGSVFVLLAFLTLLSLLSPTRGQVTSALIQGLRTVFGVGVWLVPFLVGGLGVWLALRGMLAERSRGAGWRAAGAVTLFLAIEGAAQIATGVTEPWRRRRPRRAAGWSVGCWARG